MGISLTSPSATISRPRWLTYARPLGSGLGEGKLGDLAAGGDVEAQRRRIVRGVAGGSEGHPPWVAKPELGHVAGRDELPRPGDLAKRLPRRIEHVEVARGRVPRA